MYSPDLIQRIYFEKKNGDARNLNRVFADLRASDLTSVSKFCFNNIAISWTCFESKRYDDIIIEADGIIYFYLRDDSLTFEVIIPAHIDYDKRNKLLVEMPPRFRYIWVIGDYFPGLESCTIRPVKINLPRIKNKPYGAYSITHTNCRFIQMLEQYKSLSQPIFEPIDYQKYQDSGKPWKKIVDKKR